MKVCSNEDSSRQHLLSLDRYWAPGRVTTSCLVWTERAIERGGVRSNHYLGIELPDRAAQNGTRRITRAAFHASGGTL